ncbi:hypothetical protein [Rubrivirga sp.]
MGLSRGNGVTRSGGVGFRQSACSRPSQGVLEAGPDRDVRHSPG